MKIIVNEGFISDLASGIMKLSTMALKSAWWLSKKGFEIVGAGGNAVSKLNGGKNISSLFFNKYKLNKLVIEAFVQSFSGEYAQYFRAYLNKMANKVDFAKIVLDYRKPLPSEIMQRDEEDKELEKIRQKILYERKTIAYPLIITPMYNFFLKKLFQDGFFIKNFTTGNRTIDSKIHDTLKLVLLSDESMKFLVKISLDGDNFTIMLNKVFGHVEDKIKEQNRQSVVNDKLREGWRDFFGMEAKNKTVYELASDIVKKLKFPQDIESDIIKSFVGFGFEAVGRTLDGQTKPLAMAIFEGVKVRMIATFSKLTTNCGENFKNFNIFINKLFQDNSFLNEFGKEFNERLVDIGINGIDFKKGKSSQIYKMANTERQFDDDRQIGTLNKKIDNPQEKNDTIDDTKSL